jgi:hypothetical protein
VQSRLARGAGAALAAAALAGCGAPPASHLAVGAADREWVQNANGVIDQLTGDVSDAALAGPGLRGARRSLTNLSDLYGLLVAYTDFGGCTRMVTGIGDPPARYEGVVRGLDRACAGFEHAAGLFTRAASGHDAHALLAASDEVKIAAALLYRATVAFAGARSAPS